MGGSLLAGITRGSARTSEGWRAAPARITSCCLTTPQDAPNIPATATYAELHGDVTMFHHNRNLEGSLFQVASQFNVLEMAHPSVGPGTSSDVSAVCSAFSRWLLMLFVPPACVVDVPC